MPSITRGHFLLFYATFLIKSNSGQRLQRLSSPFWKFLQHLVLQDAACLIFLSASFLSFFFSLPFSFLLTLFEIQLLSKDMLFLCILNKL